MERNGLYVHLYVDIGYTHMNYESVISLIYIYYMTIHIYIYVPTPPGIKMMPLLDPQSWLKLNIWERILSGVSSAKISLEDWSRIYGARFVRRSSGLEAYSNLTSTPVKEGRLLR